MKRTETKRSLFLMKDDEKYTVDFNDETITSTLILFEIKAESKIQISHEQIQVFSLG